MTTLIHDNAPAPMVYAHKIEWSKPVARITPDNWHRELLQLQGTSTGISAMWEVLAWEHSGAKEAEQAREKDAVIASRMAEKAKQEARKQAEARQAKLFKTAKAKRLEECAACEFCAKEFLRTSSVKRFCSETCRTASKYKRATAAREVVGPPCPVCSQEFERVRANQKYCPACVKDEMRRQGRERAKRSKAGDARAYQIACTGCGKQFSSNRATDKTCSPECRIIHKRRWKREARSREASND